MDKQDPGEADKGKTTNKSGRTWCLYHKMEVTFVTWFLIIINDVGYEIRLYWSQKEVDDFTQALLLQPISGLALHDFPRWLPVSDFGNSTNLVDTELSKGQSVVSGHWLSRLRAGRRDHPPAPKETSVMQEVQDHEYQPASSLERRGEATHPGRDAPDRPDGEWRVPSLSDCARPVLCLGEASPAGALEGLRNGQRGRGRADPSRQLQAEIERLRAVVTELSAENLQLKKGLWP